MIPIVRWILYGPQQEKEEEQLPPEEDFVPWEKDDLLQLFESGEASDVVLQCGDKRFPVHTGVISPRCDVFNGIFRSGNDNPIYITDIGHESLEDMLRFIYSGKMAPYKSLHHTMKLFEAANKYEVEPLRKKCLKLIKEHINEDSACDILVFADNRKIGKLKDVVISFLVERKRFLLSETFKIFSESHPKLAVDVLLAFVRKTPS